MLEKTQSLFWDLITAPEGVAPDLAEEWFEGDDKLSATRRLNIYANMYFWRIADAIQEDFPEVFRTIGEKNGHNLMVDYLLAHPSSSPLLQYAGRYLSDFLKKHPLSKQWPNLSVIALLEWERAMMFEAPDSDYLTMNSLKKIPAEKWPDLVFEFVPALKIVVLEPNNVVCVWRKEYAVYDKKIDTHEKRAMEMVMAKKIFAKVCEEIGSAETAAGFLGDWVAVGMLRG